MSTCDSAAETSPLFAKPSSLMSDVETRSREDDVCSSVSRDL